jgi:hypothetical protein
MIKSRPQDRIELIPRIEYYYKTTDHNFYLDKDVAITHQTEIDVELNNIKSYKIKSIKERLNDILNRSPIKYLNYEHVVDLVLQVLSEKFKIDDVVFIKDLLCFEEESKY